MQKPSLLLLLLLASVPMAASPAFAQGNSGRARPARKPATPSSPAPATAGRTVLPVSARAFGAWLDDADLVSPGSAVLGVSIGRWSSRDGGETDAPAFDVAVGVSDRVQFSASVPYYRASYVDGFKSSGLADTYLASKIKLVDAGTHGFGVAISPLLEILSSASVSDTTLGLTRVNWALPVSVQAGNDRTRVYSTVGYFSRGAVFAGAALNQAVSSRATIVGTISLSHSTKASATTDLAGLSQTRTDATGGASFKLSPAVTLSGSLGRTVSKMDQNGARLIAGLGLSVTVGHRPASQP